MSAVAIAAAVISSWSLGSARAVQLDGYSREQADFVARRLYQAVLGRQIDPDGLTQTIAELQRGDLQKHVEGLVGSREFQQNVSRRQPAAILEQIYRGLLNRAPDSGGVSTYLGDVERRRYAEVVVKIVESPEFERMLPGGPRRAAPRREGPPPSSRGVEGFGLGPGALDLATACQEAVLEEIRADRGERAFVRFGEAEFDQSGRSEQVRGVGTDLSEGDRRFRYRCDLDRPRGRVAQATYTFEGPMWDPVERIPALRACQDAVRREAGRDRNLMFESAGIMPLGRDSETIRGRAREVNGFWSTRGSGRVYEFACGVRNGRVVDATIRSAR
jgi:hypothetical protein